MLGVDRLDMIKGIPQKLLAFEKFLEEHPEWRDKVLLVQIAVPSRTDVPEYRRLRSLVHEIVGRINGRYGTLTHVPIHHLDRQLAFAELAALYAITDVCLVTSLRDGMNLVSYEFVACQSDNAGVLVLSEFAGAAQSLGAGAVLVNPWNVTDVAAAIGDALTLSDAERRERHRQNYHHIVTHTAQTWADTFISELNDTHVEAELRTKHIPPQLDPRAARGALARARRRLVVLGVNATLVVSPEDAPRAAKRAFDAPHTPAVVAAATKASLAALSADPSTVVVIFSGSDRAKLDAMFGDLPVWLAAENGVFLRAPHGGWTALVDLPKKEWMEAVTTVFDYFCERTPRSCVDARSTSVVWSYKAADAEFGRLQARDLLQHLWTGPISNARVDIVQGSRSVEVRPVGVSKGLCMQRVVGAMADAAAADAAATGAPPPPPFDCVLVAGHFLSRDENIFTFFEGRLPSDADDAAATYPPRPGGATSVASYNDGHALKGAPGATPPRSPPGPQARGPLEPPALGAGGGGVTTPARTPPPLAPLPEGVPVGDVSPPPRGGAASPGAAMPVPRSRQAYIPSAGVAAAAPRSPGAPAQPWRSLQDAGGLAAAIAGRGEDGGRGDRRGDRGLADQPPLAPVGDWHGATLLPLPPPALFTCTVGRKRSQARYFLPGAGDVADLLASLAADATERAAAANGA